MATSNQNLEEEIKKLKAENAKLKKEVSAKQSPEMETSQKQLADSMRDSTKILTNEASKIFRGVTLSFLEGVRTYTESVNEFVEEVSKRNNPNQDASPAELASNLPGDIMAGMAKSFNKLAEVSGKSIDKFYESYNETSEKEVSS